MQYIKTSAMNGKKIFTVPTIVLKYRGKYWKVFHPKGTIPLSFFSYYQAMQFISNTYHEGVREYKSYRHWLG